METLNIDAMGVQAYLFAVRSASPSVPFRSDALREHLERHPLERLPFYLRILEERDWARRDGKPIPFEHLVASTQSWAEGINLGKVPVSALPRLSNLGTADPLVCSLFFGPPATSPLSADVEALLAASLREPESFRLWLHKKASSFPTPDLIKSLYKAIGMRRRGGLLFGYNPFAVRSEDARVREAVQFFNSFLDRRPGSGDESPTKALQERERAKEREALQERYLQLLKEATEKGYAIRGEDLMRIAKASQTANDSPPQIPWWAKNREGAVGVPFVPQDPTSLNVDEVLGIAPEAPPCVKEPWERDELGFALRMGAVDALATKAAERLGLPTGDLSKAVGYALLGVAFDLGGHLGRPGLAKLGGELGPALNVWSAARGVGALSTILESLFPAEAPEDILSGVRMVAEEAGLVEGDAEAPTAKGKDRRAQR